MLDVAASLINKSILVGEQNADVVRYRMLETIRELGRERLEETGDHERSAAVTATGICSWWNAPTPTG